MNVEHWKSLPLFLVYFWIISFPFFHCFCLSSSSSPLFFTAFILCWFDYLFLHSESFCSWQLLLLTVCFSWQLFMFFIPLVSMKFNLQILDCFYFLIIGSVFLIFLVSSLSWNDSHQTMTIDKGNGPSIHHQMFERPVLNPFVIPSFLL